MGAHLFNLLRRTGFAVPFIFLLASCATDQPSQLKPSGKTDSLIPTPGFQQISFRELPATPDSSWTDAKKAFLLSCNSRAFSSATLWKSACQQAQKSANAKQFFQSSFTVWRVFADQTIQGTRVLSEDTGLMTGYYEPILLASATKTSSHAWPVLSTPDDLIDVDLASLYPELKGKRVRGKLQGRKLLPYDDRSAIDKRQDLSRYAIAWLADPIDQLFLQIQGSGQLEIPGKGKIRVTYDNQNGHPYKAVAKWLIDRGELTASQASMQSIRAWAKKNPRQVPDLRAYNPSYVFFKKSPENTFLAGPKGAQGIPLTAGASVAVDRKYWKLGTPFFVSVSQKLPDLHFSKPVIAQDTGGAIRGIIRFDYFWGSGDSAGESAGRQKSQAKAWVFVPRGHSPEELLAR